MKADEWENDPDRRGFYWRFAALCAGLRQQGRNLFLLFYRTISLRESKAKALDYQRSPCSLCSPRAKRSSHALTRPPASQKRAAGGPGYVYPVDAESKSEAGSDVVRRTVWNPSVRKGRERVRHPQLRYPPGTGMSRTCSFKQGWTSHYSRPTFLSGIDWFSRRNREPTRKP
jgi:hypothetical protein